MSKSKKIPSAGKRLITRLDISKTHPSGAPLPTDMFYVGIANKVYPIVEKSFRKLPCYTPALSKQMAITLTCYVEDLVSGAGVWEAFTSLHKKKYGKKMPFYDDGSLEIMPYSDDYPSFHAVLFLLWYVANLSDSKTILHPNNHALLKLALDLIPILVCAYDDAPDTISRPKLLPEEVIGYPLFFQVRDLCEWLTTGCYLTRVKDMAETTRDFENFINHAIGDAKNFDNDALRYAISSFVPMNTLIGPLAIPAYEWLAEIISLQPAPGEEKYLPILKSIESRPYAYYQFAKVSETEAVLKSVDGKKLTFSAETMPNGKFDNQVVAGNSAMLSIVYFNGVWLMNGISFLSLPPELFEEGIKEHHEKVKQRKAVQKFYRKQFGNNRIGVCGSYEEYLKLAFGDNIPPINSDPKLIADMRDVNNLVYFLGEDGDFRLLPGWGTALKIKDNPYYDVVDAKLSGTAMILTHSIINSEMRRYIIDHNLIPDAAFNSLESPQDGEFIFQDNIRFLCDYCDRDTLTIGMEL